ncbi:unnamed protein product [Umbelopsis vinacea]
MSFYIRVSRSLIADFRLLHGTMQGVMSETTGVYQTRFRSPLNVMNSKRRTQSISTMSLKEISRNKAFNGHVIKYEHESRELGCTMKFNVFLPEKSSQGKVPALYFLSGLTCNEDNFMQKSGALKEASKHSIALIAPDTSPRGVKVDGDDESWDFGTGAGFYVDATEEKWKKHYRMYSYIVKELPAVVYTSLPISVSAFSPIANPSNCPWGHKAFGGYLGNENKEHWKQYDACELLKAYNGKSLDILVDVGTRDNFLNEQLKLDELNYAAESCGRQDQVHIRFQDGYDHSYYFISTFIADHIEHHAGYLNV